MPTTYKAQLPIDRAIAELEKELARIAQQVQRMKATKTKPIDPIQAAIQGDLSGWDKR